ncbi:MAG: flagellar hook-basal body complex protein [Bacillota bacterium]|nr:flagellar hook-basal body complex protein [Bacillota bacterium]
MLNILWNGRTAMNAQQDRLDCISNNIANMDTEGYKREDVSFEDLVQDSLQRKGYPETKNDNRMQQPFTGTGVKATSWLRDNSQGNLQQTNTSTDLAIDGEGYFRVTLPDGTKAYERGGSFNLDSTGLLVDKNGNRLEIQYDQAALNSNFGGKIPALTENNFKVDNQGNITVASGDSYITVGKINLFNAVGGDTLMSVGKNLYVPKTGAQIYQVTNADILQGYLEKSNVDMSKEMTDMIMAQRNFEMSSKALKTGDDMWGIVNNMRGK